jgi:KDO transferase-3
MAELDPRFKLVYTGSEKGVFWKGNKLNEATPINLLKQQKSNRAAFIVASGPSLREMDIQAISNHASFGVNGSILKFEEQGINPDFYVISDQSFVREHPGIMTKIVEANPHAFFTPAVLNEICLIEPDWLKAIQFSVFENHFKPHNQKILTYREIMELASTDHEIVTHTGKVGFSLNPEKGVFTAHTIVYFALQLAYGLGFSTIGILGMDLGSNGGSLRFYQSNHRKAPSHVVRDYDTAILPSFMVVRQLIQQGVLDVYNLSPNSRLPDSVIPKLTLPELMNLLSSSPD